MDALVMAGGPGTRLRADVEKPLLRVGGEPMLDRVLRAVAAADVGAVHVAVSPHTPETRTRLAGDADASGGEPAVPDRYADLPIEALRVVDTPGDGYVEDLDDALEAVGRPAVTVAADLPLLAAEHVDRAIEASNAGEQSLTVRVPAALKRLLGATCDQALYGNAPTGLNVVGPTDAPGGTLRSFDARLAINVNTLGDARIAEALL